MNEHALIISPGQGLLLLIDHYKTDPIKVEKLKKLYLSGAETVEDGEEIKALLKDPALSSYQVSFEATTINEDLTRRYFETHLAYETLVSPQGLSNIDYDELREHVDKLYAMIPDNQKKHVAHVLKGESRPNAPPYMQEYADYINKIKNKKMFKELSDLDRGKVELLVQSAFLGVVNARLIPLPIDIYGTGIYSEENKGKKMLEGQDSTRSQNLGLMKGHMPLALTDIARSDEEIPYLKPSDQAAFVAHAQWVESNFGKMVHPFSNSISGTMLCQLRVNAKLSDENDEVFSDTGERMQKFCQLLISARLFHSGGHTLNEYVAPLALDAVREAFFTTPGFDKINLESMFYTGNEDAFDAALDDTIEYNKTILMRQALHAQLRNEIPTEIENATLKRLQLGSKWKDTQTNIKNLKDSYEQHFKHQLLRKVRIGKNKNILIQNSLEQAILHTNKGELNQALQVILELKKNLIEQYGSTNLWGGKSESIKVVESAEAELKSLIEADLSVKERLQVMKESEPPAEKEMEPDGVEKNHPDKLSPQ